MPTRRPTLLIIATIQVPTGEELVLGVSCDRITCIWLVTTATHLKYTKASVLLVLLISRHDRVALALDRGVNWCCILLLVIHCDFLLQVLLRHLLAFE